MIRRSPRGRERCHDARKSARALRTIGGSPEEMRRHVLDTMLDVVDAEHAYFFSVGERDGQFAVRRWLQLGQGPSEREQWERQVLNARLRWLLDNLSARDTDCFAEMRALFPDIEA